LGPPLNFTPQKRKEKTLHVQVAQVEGLAARQPLLMLWEDIHWSDPTTLESLDLLIDRAATLRVLMILTFRPEFTPPWVGRPHVTLLSLNRLPPRHRAEMIAHVTGGKTLPRDSVRRTACPTTVAVIDLQLTVSALVLVLSARRSVFRSVLKSSRFWGLILARG
jgi:hypothetical protein